MTAKYQGILFDFDGTLADTMEDNYRAWVAVVKPYGIELGRAEYFPLEGMELRKMAAHIFELHGQALTVDPLKIVQAKDAHFVAHHSFKLFPGVIEFVDRCRAAGVRTGIVTAARRDRLVQSVPQDFLARFTTVVSGDRLERGKPFPDPYLLGAKELGLAPENCIVVENAPLGIEAAKAAGCFCVGVTSTLEREVLGQADVVVGEFAELPGVLVVKTMLGLAQEMT